MPPRVCMQLAVLLIARSALCGQKQTGATQAISYDYLLAGSSTSMRIWPPMWPCCGILAHEPEIRAARATTHNRRARGRFGGCTDLIMLPVSIRHSNCAAQCPELSLNGCVCSNRVQRRVEENWTSGRMSNGQHTTQITTRTTRFGVAFAFI